MTPFDPHSTEYADPLPTDPICLSPPVQLGSEGGDPVAALARRRRRRIDRHEVARMLAVGYPVSEVAEKVGCHRQHIWRLMRKSNRVRYAVAVAENEVASETAGRLSALRPTIFNEILRRMYDDRGVLLWAAKASGLADGGGYVPPLQAVQTLPPNIVQTMSHQRQEIEYCRGEIARYARMLRDAEQGDVELEDGEGGAPMSPPRA
jgi:hypothetical protein